MSTGLAIGRPGRVAGRMQTILVLGITLAAILALSWWVTAGNEDRFTEIQLDGAGGAGPVVGMAPPAFSGIGYDGTPISLADYAGQPLWLTFGGAWCRDCRVEMPELIEAYEANRGRGLAVLGVFISEPAADTAAYAERAGIPFPIVSDPTNKIASAYRLMGVPTHLFIGRDGLVKEVRIGALARDQMEASIEAILR